MDQELLNTSRYKIYSISIDSRFADQTYSGSGDFMIRLPSTQRNIMRIGLSSVELPLVENVFSETHGNLYLSGTLGGTPFACVIPSGNYTATTLCAAVQTALQGTGVLGAGNFTCVLDPYTQVVTIKNTGTSFTLVLHSNVASIASRATHWGIGYYLGFRSKNVASAQLMTPYSVTGVSPVLVAPTPYYLLQLQCPDQIENITHRVATNASIPAFAKLILRDGVYTLQFDDSSNLLRKEYTFLTPVNIAQLRVKLVDPYGEVVDMRGMDWSMTYELYEVVNSNVYRDIGHIYDR
jgi:hypothetical protein